MKAVIIEDEPLAVDNLKFYLKDHPVNIVGSAYRIKDAVNLIKKEKPDVIFLDINLSGENGFDLLSKIDMDIKVVFVTAHNEFAVDAFEVNALDYILKPLQKERIDKTIKRLLDNKNKNVPKNKFAVDDIIFFPSAGRPLFTKVQDITFVEAESSYSKIFFTEGEHKVMARTLKKWEELLPEKDFIRIHRSYLVNINNILDMKKRINGTYVVNMKGSKKSIKISRRYASELRQKQNLIK